MEQKLFLELNALYSSAKGNSNIFRLRLRMRDPVDPEVLRRAADTAMKRYPYFCVELRKEGGEFVFAENRRPVAVVHSLRGVELNSEGSNYHMLSFSWWEDWVILDVFHGMTDGAGAYEILRTLLYYYCSERYQVTLGRDGIRLAGDEISREEWDDPVRDADLPEPEQAQMPKALDPGERTGIARDGVKTVFSIAVSEGEFMRFNLDHDGSPGTMVSLLLSRAIARVNPKAADPIRIVLCVNQRAALHAPLAHHSLVGGAMLEYMEKLRAWPLDRQATAYRGMVFAQTREEAVLAGVNGMRGVTQLLLSRETDQERIALAGMIGGMGRSMGSATVSYIGKASFGEAERYVRELHVWTSSAYDVTVEISAVNGQFTLDFIQLYSDPAYFNAFLRELEENGIAFDRQEANAMDIPDLRLPWTE